MEAFAQRYCQCNPGVFQSTGTIAPLHNATLLEYSKKLYGVVFIMRNSTEILKKVLKKVHKSLKLGLVSCYIWVSRLIEICMKKVLTVGQDVLAYKEKSFQSCFI